MDGRRSRTRQVLASTWGSGGWRRSGEQVVVEEPLEVRLDGNLVATTMRTPGHDYELAAGLCATDGLLGGAEVTGVRYCTVGSAAATEFNIVDVLTGGVAPVPKPRLGNVSSSCGLCGSTTIAELAERLEPVDPAGQAPAFTAQALWTAAEAVRERQELFAATGGLHAAATFNTAGEVLVVREDIGRHNAVDKVVGQRLLARREGGAKSAAESGAQGTPAPSQLALFVSGRASFEIIQKAWAAGFATVAAVSAPSALAVEAAERAGITLVGFVRSGQLNVYTGALADPGAQAKSHSVTRTAATKHPAAAEAPTAPSPAPRQAPLEVVAT